MLYNTKFLLLITSACFAAALAGMVIVAPLSPATLLGLRRLLPSVTYPLLPPSLCFLNRCLSWLASPICPHPRTELKQSAAITSVRTGVCNCPLTTSNAVGKCGVLVASNKARNERNSA